MGRPGSTFEQGGHTVRTVLAADEVIKSPGIPESASIVRSLRDQGVPVIGEIEFAARHTDAPIIGITGSNGKTTTTLLVHHILSKAGMDVGLGGNVGTSFAGLMAQGDTRSTCLS